MTLAVLVVAGILAFGLPRLSPRAGRRFWHSWIDNGMLPMLLGLGAAVLLQRVGRHHGGHDDAQVLDALGSLLGLALATAGVLIGTQFRMVYFVRAGPVFLGRHSRRAGIVALIAGLPGLLLIDAGLGVVMAVCALLASLALATSQRPPVSAYAFDVRHRDIVAQHIAPAGWWNLLALILCSLGEHLGLTRSNPEALAQLPPIVQQFMPGWMLAPLLSVAVGLGLGLFAKGARNRSEASLFLLAVLGLSAGLALLLGGSPLLTGIIVGACFVNMALGRLGMIERLLLDLEQPVVIAAGFVGGVLIGLMSLPRMGPLWPWTAVAVGLVVVARPLLRLRWSPSHGSVATRMERSFAAPGATGILLLATLPLAPRPLADLAPMVIWALLVLNGVSEWLEWRLANRARADLAVAH